MCYVDPIPPTILLTPENFGSADGFTCAGPGQQEQRWERDLRLWITDRGRGAMAAAEIGEAEVYLYFDGNQLVGYGSIGIEQFELEAGRGMGAVYVLPYLAVHTSFRGQGLRRERRWGRRILGGLIEEVERRGQLPWLMLYVDPENPARQLYKEFGFAERPEPWIDPSDGREWVIMARRLKTAQ